MAKLEKAKVKVYAEQLSLPPGMEKTPLGKTDLEKIARQLMTIANNLYAAVNVNKKSQVEPKAKPPTPGLKR